MDNIPILNVENPKYPKKIHNLKHRCLRLSPTVNAGLEPEATIKDFEKDPRLIGKGGFGEVWKVTHKATNKIYCIKIIKKESIIQQKLVDQMNREIEIMYLLNHPHCLRLKNHFEDNDYFYLVMPLATKGQLYRILRRVKKFDERTAAQILRETISALMYLHSFKPPIIHRDLKPENLLLNENGRIFLADFGWSNFKNDGDIRKTFCGTPEYIAPEMLRKEGHDHRIDIWSVGVLMFELLAGYSPFAAHTNQELYSNIKRLKIHWPQDMPPFAKDLITKILKLNPAERLPFDKILQHKWFQTNKELFPLLQNDYHNLKDLLMFHMLNKVTPDVEAMINDTLQITEIRIKAGQDKGNQIDKSKEKKLEIMKKIKENENANYSSANQNITQEKFNTLQLDVQKLTRENLNMKAKMVDLENENKNLKAENQKLKEISNTDFQEKIRNLNSEIERLQIKDKDRFAVLSELEEKNNLIRELNTKIQLLETEKDEKIKNEEMLQNQIKELNKQISLKELTEQYLTKKADTLAQEKEQQFFESQKKIEAMQMKLLDASTSGTSSNEDSVAKAISQLTESVNELKTYFERKFNVFMENFELFKKEYNYRDDKFKEILNEKSTAIIDLVQSYYSSIGNDIKNIFDKAQQSTEDVKGQRIEWLNKKMNEYQTYKTKAMESERKISEITVEKDNLNKKLTVKTEEFETFKKNGELKAKEFDNIMTQQQDLFSKLKDFRPILQKNTVQSCLMEYDKRFPMAK
ncbi:MAG: protein kinase [archaeon]|nr:protein kinase [archaeon]